MNSCPVPRAQQARRAKTLSLTLNVPVCQDYEFHREQLKTFSPCDPSRKERFAMGIGAVVFVWVCAPSVGLGGSYKHTLGLTSRHTCPKTRKPFSSRERGRVSVWIHSCPELFMFTSGAKNSRTWQFTLNLPLLFPFLTHKGKTKTTSEGHTSISLKFWGIARGQTEFLCQMVAWVMWRLAPKPLCCPRTGSSSTQVETTVRADEVQSV